MSTLARRAAATVEDRPAAALSSKPRANRREGITLALCSTVVNVAVALYLVFRDHYVAGDALSRVANAYYVLFSRVPHLAAIGFVWNPLPSILELPLVALHGLWPALVTNGLAGSVLSSLFGGGSVYFLDKVLFDLRLPRGWRVVASSAFALNPLIILYAANGMTEIMLICSLLACLSGVVRYLSEPDTQDLRALTGAAVWLGLAFMIRYEAAAFAAFLAVGLGVALLLRGHDARRIRAELLIALTPFVYAVGIWMYFNWLIMKSPLYFMTSVYGSASQIATGVYTKDVQALLSAYHSVWRTVVYVMHFVTLYWPFAIGLVGTLLLGLKRRDVRSPILAATAVSIPMLQAILIYLGKSAGWNRFFIYEIPFGIVLIGLVSSYFNARRAILIGSLVLLLVGDVGTVSALGQPITRQSDTPNLSVLLVGRPLSTSWKSVAVVRYLNAHPNLLVLVDTFRGYPIVLQVNNPKRLIISSDPDFESILMNPRGRVDAILVPQPVGLGALDAVNRAWPGIWSGSLPWARLLRSFPGSADHFRLFSVTQTAP